MTLPPRPRRTAALVGNPNTGKTTLFNALSGLSQRVGNYPGVTVETKKGHTTCAGAPFDVIDLPGTYSLAPPAPPPPPRPAAALMGARDAPPAPPGAAPRPATPGAAAHPPPPDGTPNGPPPRPAPASSGTATPTPGRGPPSCWPRMTST